MSVAVVAIDVPAKGILLAADVMFNMTVLLVRVLDTPKYASQAMNRFWNMVENSESLFTETCVALFTLLTGLWMLPFAPRGPARSWEYALGQLMPLSIYGVVFVTIGVLIIIGLHYDSLRIRWLGQFCALLAWAFLFFFVATMFPHFLVAPISFVICLMALRSCGFLGRLNIYGGRPTNTITS